VTGLATAELVTVAFIKTMAGFTNGMVSTTLPTDNTSWAASGFAVVGPPVGGGQHPMVPWRTPVMQVDCYAVTVGSDNPPWSLACGLAEAIVAGTYDHSLLGQALTLRSGYEQARVTGATVIGGPRRQRGDPAAYAWYQLDLEINWVGV
jgi:hypothetical protein